MALSGHQRILFSGIGVMLSAIAAWLWHVTFYNDYFIMWRILTGLLAMITSLCAMAGFHVQTMRCSKYTSTVNVILLYIIGTTIVKWSMSLTHRKFLQSAKDIPRIQEEFLQARLKKHANTEYGIRYRFQDISNSAEFRSRHPLTNYNHYREFIQREADGERGVLLPEKPAQIALTSGTTGKPKMILVSEEQKSFPESGSFTATVTTVLNRLSGNHPRALQKYCMIYVDPKATFTKSGIMMASATKYTERDHTKLKLISNTPVAGFQIPDETTAYYVHALFSLRDRDTGLVSGYFASVVHSFLRLIESQWTKLVDDIERGTLNTALDLSPDARLELERHLVPDPERAVELKREFQRGFEGIVTRVWPHLTCIVAITTGSFSVYADILRQRYCKGTLIYSALYIMSEGWIGTTLWPDDPQLRETYILFPDGAFFEFIKVNQSEEDQPSTLLLHELEIGESYELVMTNMSGLYRYRPGDVIKVVDYFNKSPTIEFQYRIGEVLNIKGEKTSEDCIVSALTNTLSTWGDVRLDEYACAENTLVDAVENITSDTPHYVIFVEIRGLVITTEWDKRTRQLDEELCNIATAYRFLRNKDSVGSLRLVAVRAGSFVKLREFIINNSSATSNQFKIPRKLRKEEWVEFMLARAEQ